MQSGDSNVSLQVSCSTAELCWASPAQGLVVLMSDKEEEAGGTDTSHLQLEGSVCGNQETDRQTSAPDKEQGAMKAAL